MRHGIITSLDHISDVTLRPNTTNAQSSRDSLVKIEDFYPREKYQISLSGVQEKDDCSKKKEGMHMKCTI